MRIAKIAVALCLFLGVSLSASGPVGVFAVVEKVVFEPAGTTATNAERVQVWGAFSYAYGGIESGGPVSDIERGYYYFALPPEAAKAQIARTEWADLKAVAGTGQAVAFGQWMTPAQERIDPVAVLVPGNPGHWARPVHLLVVQKTLPPGNAPTVYITNTGIVKMHEATHANLIKRLRDALVR
jgi:hypothetical protein